jgi:hypothetical protein
MNFHVIIGSSNLPNSKLEEFIKFPCRALNLSLLNAPHGNQLRKCDHLGMNTHDMKLNRILNFYNRERYK